MDKIQTLINLMLAQAATDPNVAETGMRADGWFMLIFGILLLYGGLAVCLWIASGKGSKESWEDEDE